MRLSKKSVFSLADTGTIFFVFIGQPSIAKKEKYSGYFSFCEVDNNISLLLDPLPLAHRSAQSLYHPLCQQYPLPQRLLCRSTQKVHLLYCEEQWRYL